MSDYDAMIGNIYLPGQAVATHRDITESKSAKNYPVIVYTIGAGNAINIYENINNPGKTSFASDKKTSIPTKTGTIYTFGMDGKGRFEMAHDTPVAIQKGETLEPITLPDGTKIKDYTITLTFRRASNLKPGMPTAPAKITTQPVFQPAVQAQPQTVSEGSNSLQKSIFDNISKELYNKFKFVNPGSENTPSIKDILVKYQDVIEDDWLELKRRCYQ
jgi:hypothetical protein